MEDNPRDLMDFETRFASEDACRAYLAQLRLPDGFLCPGCASASAWKTGRDLWLCQRCGLQTSLLAGTIFQDTKKPLQMWIRAMWHITSQKHGGNALGLQRTPGLGSYERGGPGCTSSGEPRFGLAEIAFSALCRPTRHTWVG